MAVLKVSAETVDALLRRGANPQLSDALGRDVGRYGAAQLLQIGASGGFHVYPGFREGNWKALGEMFICGKKGIFRSLLPPVPFSSKDRQHGQSGTTPGPLQDCTKSKLNYIIVITRYIFSILLILVLQCQNSLFY
ncbi:hypothetical protein UPYG_G00191290 [Umbra pygmaea]|uniref:Uncharacterized protein n=1 Tax=Umbra pygmaea TaxID=75934 RepID=A0ABD0WXI5_UMBPY